MQILDYPFHKVIFKCPLYELVKKVRGKEFMDICTWKSMCKRLVDDLDMSKWREGTELKTNHDVILNPKLIPQEPRIKLIDKKVGLLVQTAVASGAIKIRWMRITSRTGRTGISSHNTDTLTNTYLGHQFKTIPASQTCSG